MKRDSPEQARLHAGHPYLRHSMLEAGVARARTLVTEREVRAAKKTGEPLWVPEDALVTAAAEDAAAALGVRILRACGAPAGDCDPASGTHEKPFPGPVALGADHGGFELKESIKKFLETLGWRVIDVGTWSADAVDYPDFALAAARRVAQGGCPRAVIVDGAGIGSCMAANKVPGVRAAFCHDLATVRNSREHNDANVLTLGAKTDPAKVLDMVKAWLEIPFGGGRHARRVNKIVEIERRFAR